MNPLPLNTLLPRRPTSTLTRHVVFWAFIVFVSMRLCVAAQAFAGEPAASGALRPGAAPVAEEPTTPAGNNVGAVFRPASVQIPPAPSPAVAAEDPDAPLIELDGSISISPDGSELSYRWKQLSGPRVTLSDPGSARPQFRTNTPGSYEFQLIVSANGLDSEPYVVRLEIEKENLPPVARVNATETWGHVGKQMQVDGSESFDPEGEMLSYEWRVLTPGLIIPPDALRKPVLVVEPNVDGMFEVELVVSDGEKTSSVRLRLGIKPRPVPPVAQARIVTVTIPAGATATSGEGTQLADLAPMASPRAAEAAPLRPGPDPVPVIRVPAPSLSPPPAPVVPVPPAAVDMRPPAPIAELSPGNDLIAALASTLALPPAPSPEGLPELALAPEPERMPVPASALRPDADEPGRTPQIPVPAPTPGPTSQPLAQPQPRPAGTGMQSQSSRFASQPDLSAMPPPALGLQPLPVATPRERTSVGKSLLTRSAPEKTPVEKLLEMSLPERAGSSAMESPAPGTPAIDRLSGAGDAPAGKAPDAPVAVVVAPTHALAGSLVRMDATQSYDPGGNQLVYRWRQTGGPKVTKYSIDERLGDAAPGFRPEAPGLYSFSLSVFNGTTASEPIDIDISVAPAQRVAAPTPVNEGSPASRKPSEPGLRRVPELTPLPNSQPPPTRFPRPRFESARERPAAKVLLGEGRK